MIIRIHCEVWLKFSIMTLLISNLIKTENISFKKDKRRWKIDIFSHFLWWGVNTIKSKASKGNIASGAPSRSPSTLCFSLGVHPCFVLWRESFVNTICAMKKMQLSASLLSTKQAFSDCSLDKKHSWWREERPAHRHTGVPATVHPDLALNIHAHAQWGVTWLSELHQEVQETSSSRLPFIDTFICVLSELYWQGIWKLLPSVKTNTAIRSSSSSEVKYCDKVLAKIR